MFFKSWLPFRKKVQEDIVTKTIRLLTTLKNERIELLYLSEYSIIEITVPDKNIVSYIKTLQTINSMLDSNLAINTSNVPIVMYKIYARDFFADNKGCYIDANLELERFIEEAKKFMLTYTSFTLLPVKSYEQEKTLERFLDDYKFRGRFA